MIADGTTDTEVRPVPPSVRLPLAKPIVTNILLGLIGVGFLAEVLISRSVTDILTSASITAGAQVNSLIVGGDYWRLLTAVFLHAGLMHLAFNGWALFSVGRDMESLLGSGRFTAIYLLSGLAGNVAYYLLGPNVPSLGASGAIFGLIGAEAAFFLRNRPLFGRFGGQRLVNLAIMIGINLVFGFTVPGINNIAHLGGLLTGFALGYVMAPHYQIEWALVGAKPVGRMRDRTPRQWRWLGIGTVILLLLAGVWLGNQRWAESGAVLRQQAQAALDANDLAGAEALLTRAAAADPTDPDNHYALGVVQAQLGKLSEAAASLETVLQQVPNQVDSELMLGLVYAEQGRAVAARVMLKRFLAQENEGQRADYARQALDNLPE
jgi:rhomboid protease GluP